MNFRIKWAILAVLIAIIEISRYCLSHYPNLIFIYDKIVFYPFQSFRHVLLDFIPFSAGDVIYIACGIALCYTFARWVYFIVKFRTYKSRLAASFLNFINIVLFAWLFFIVGWGANYYKQPLKQFWDLPPHRAHDTAGILAFDEMLTEKLNFYAPYYHTLSLQEINKRSKSYYHLYTNCVMKNYGLGVKPSLFSPFMESMAIDGYYNPFTGEGQVNDGIPSFMQPFVLCHEMAHQAGIAAEDDANLMAYALGTIAADSSFNYSSYFNIWLYAHNRLYRIDSAKARKLESQLNKLTRAHLDTLEQISRKYHNEATRYTNALYDNYLKMQDQKEGIRSYGNVASTAWLLELKRAASKPELIKIP
jgi:hypothetical protein